MVFEVSKHLRSRYVDIYLFGTLENLLQNLSSGHMTLPGHIKGYKVKEKYNWSSIIASLVIILMYL